MPFPITTPSTTGGAGPRRTMAGGLLRLWYDPRPPCAHPLFPLLRLGSWLYARGLKHDQHKARTQQRSLPVPVISVGNLVVGGTGKTPVTLWLARYLRECGYRPAILSRGYGRRSTEVACVPSEGETSPQAQQFGDEPVLLARKARHVPVWVGRERWKSGKAAIESSEADLLLLDDGFQHLLLERDLDLVLLDAHNPFGNGSLLPLGPLREPVEHLERANAIVLTRADDANKVHEARLALQRQFPGKPVFACRHRLVGLRMGRDGARIPLEALKGRSAVAFAGIAGPEGFFESLRSLDIHLPLCLPFADHHPYGSADVALLIHSTRVERARFLITTEKDMVRLPAQLQSAVLAAELEVDFGSEEEAFRTYLGKMLPGSAPFPLLHSSLVISSSGKSAQLVNGPCVAGPDSSRTVVGH